MEIECKGKKSVNWWSTVLMAAVMVAVLLLIRHSLSGWLLPDGRFLETLVEQIQTEDEPVVEAVFSGIQEWFGDD